MKKILICALFVSSGLITSCTKENVAPSVSKNVSLENLDETVDGQLGTADGDIDRPTPVKKPR